MARSVLHIRTSIDIAAPVRRVWSVLMDFASYPAWNPFILRLAGRALPGSRLSVTIRPVGFRAIALSPTVLSATPEREFRWKGFLLVRGLFDGEHGFRLVATTDATTHLVHEESFEGFLVPVAMRGRLKHATEAGFEAMNQALKRRVEQPFAPEPRSAGG